MAIMDETLRHYKFLVRLRDSGETNMFGASPYLADAYGLSSKTAQNILVDWMNTFDLPKDEQPEDGRNRREA